MASGGSENMFGALKKYVGHKKALSNCANYKGNISYINCVSELSQLLTYMKKQKATTDKAVSKYVIIYQNKLIAILPHPGNQSYTHQHELVNTLIQQSINLRK